MPRLLVQYPTLAKVLVDGTPSGDANRIIELDAGTHTVELEGEATTPPTREITIAADAAPNDIVRVGFAPADRPIERYSPLYCRYNGFLLGQFLSLSFATYGREKYPERRARMLEFLAEVGVEVALPEEPLELGGDAHAELLTATAAKLMERSRDLTEFMLLGALLTHYGVLAESDPATAKDSLDQIAWIREKHLLPPIEPERFILRDTGRGVDDVLSPSLAYLAEAIDLLPIEEGTAFVIMPFKPPYASYFATFYRPSLEEAGYRAFRAWGGLSNEDYCDLLLKLIAKSGLVWADVSELNTNVLYEIGAAHALGKLSMLVVTEAESVRIPANIGHDAVVKYAPESDDWPRGSVLLMAALLSSLKLAAERGQRLRVPPDGIENALVWVGDTLAQTLVPPEARAAAARGREKLGEHDYAAAEALFDEAIGLGLDDALTLLGRGLARVSLSKFDEAEQDLTATIEDSEEGSDISERRALAHYFRGMARESLENYAGALQDYDRAIALGFADVDLYERRAAAREQSGDHEGAAADTEHALALTRESRGAVDPEIARREATTVEFPVQEPPRAP